MKHYLCFLLFSIVYFQIHAQSEKDIEKAIKTFEKGDYDKGISQMEKIAQGSTNTKHWDLLVSLYLQRYQKVEGEDKEIMNRKAKKMLSASSDAMPSRIFTEFVDKCREATLKARSPLASRYLRELFVDYNPDTLVPKDAQDIFRKGRELYDNKQFAEARKQFAAAMKLGQRYYKAQLYFGECYRKLEDYDSAKYYYKKTIAAFPDMYEARKMLVDVMLNANDYPGAMEAAAEALLVYPDEEMFNTLYVIKHKMYMVLNRNWIVRKTYPNSLKPGEKVQDNIDFPWNFYANAKFNIKDYANNDGIVTVQNSATKQKYLEVYSWEKMLNEPQLKGQGFDFARKMQAAGYLDCYTLLCLFHQDIYPQFQNFAKNNKPKMRKFIELYITVK